MGMVTTIRFPLMLFILGLMAQIRLGKPAGKLC